MSRKYPSLADLYRLYGLGPRPSTSMTTPQRQAVARSLADALRLPSAIQPPAPGSIAWLMLQQARAKAANKTRHDAMLGRLLRQQQALLMRDIKADLPSHSNKPERIYWTATGKGHVPDLTAIYWTGLRVIYEVETADTITIDHTRDQCRLFAAYASQHGATFVLVVPIGEEWKASQQLREWRIAASVRGI